ncbi:MAG: hypothetical protein A2939_04575 [Parcubacteria group bacterium RIFCSPLOWO2_01_FULL_48_18]|nr:MAG: hypothetical protein A2939_04575 [Parcubacteria group bacterium RIFCSPLOWO2_01_FULL_48_18]OHB24145.1 MAG: hypothetical protein A3J67_01675 [Parcubacteria group bacterium RIFCSPHIGHO2_02_FULL_48_10b]
MLHQLQPKHKRKRSKRIARGGKRGTYSGRGQKGQRSRAGRRIRPAVRDFIIRLPKRRGFKNPPKSPKATVTSVGELNGSFNDGDAVTIKTLVARGLIDVKKPGRPVYVKILGDGTISKKLTIKGVSVSRQAKEKIVKAGGTIQ